MKIQFMKDDTVYTLKYYTNDELNEFREEIKLLKNNPETFLM